MPPSEATPWRKPPEKARHRQLDAGRYACRELLAPGLDNTFSGGYKIVRWVEYLRPDLGDKSHVNSHAGLEKVGSSEFGRFLSEKGDVPQHRD